jgi:hypothetical protein
MPRNEWDLLKRRFDALVHDESVAADSIEVILDIQFHRRFSELITQTARRNRATIYNWPLNTAADEFHQTQSP